ncbi:MAG: hypothetical protein IR527_02620 [Bacteroides sp.]|nr:MAG: hypothetical protein IR527_02620 [Bacteroides sp.]
MKVLKFGGTSIGTPSKIKNLTKIININDKNIIVLSAFSGTTNKLLEIINENKKIKYRCLLIEKLYNEYILFINELFTENKEYINKALLIINKSFDIIKKSDIKLSKNILAQGEIISSNILYLYLTSINIKCHIISALDFMKIDENYEPIFDFIKNKINNIINNNIDKYNLFITQGYICKNIDNEIDNLKRGGSDYTASIIGYALNSTEVQIWTDIDGMHNNDPRIIKNTNYIPELSFDSAAELSYFGAKILHPCSVLPAQKKKYQ